MSASTFVSYAQNGEDVVLWRALRHVTDGCYVDVGANSPSLDSVTKAFYDRGWRGINIEPMERDFARLQEQRPADVNVRAAVTTSNATEIVVHEVLGTGLSTLDDDIARTHDKAGLPVRDVTVPTARLDDLLATHVGGTREIHFLKVDVEGAEADVLKTVNLSTFRPWVLVVEATMPNSTEQTHDEWEPSVLAGGYTFCLFDGISRYYVADEHAELGPALSYPACVLDGYVRREEVALVAEREELLSDLIRWRGLALQTWVQAPSRRDEYDRLKDDVERLTRTAASAGLEATIAREELAQTRATLSWRVTKPLRAARRFTPSPRTP